MLLLRSVTTLRAGAILLLRSSSSKKRKKISKMMILPSQIRSFSNPHSRSVFSVRLSRGSRSFCSFCHRFFVPGRSGRRSHLCRCLSLRFRNWNRRERKRKQNTERRSVLASNKGVDNALRFWVSCRRFCWGCAAAEKILFSKTKTKIKISRGGSLL